MKKLMTIGLIALSFSVFGCSKDGEVEEFIKENDSFAKELKAKADKDGPEAAQKFFESKEPDLKKKFDAIKGARGFQVKKETTEKLTNSITESTMSICMLSIKGDKFKGLCDKYTALLSE